MELKVYTCILGCLLLAVGQIQAEGTIYPCPPFGISRIQHSSSCDRYVQCFAGVAVVRPCAVGLHYSEKDQQCMSPAKAACTREQDVCPLYNDPTNLIYHQDDVECGKYYLCYNNKLHPYTCAEGLHWDTENERCAYPEEAECGLYGIVCPPTGTANVPHPYICNRFYYCLNGVYFPHTCPADLLFDINTMNCNYPDESECASEAHPPLTTTSTPTPPTTTTESTTVTTTTEGTTTTEAPWFECPSEKFQVFRHPTRGCKWYVICEKRVPTEGECPLYTIYSDRLAICMPGACSN